MSYFIRIKNNEAFEHPIAEDNFKQAFPDIDIDNLPDEFARFVRVAPPTLGPYEIWTGTTYEWDGDIIKDVHQINNITEEEKLAKQNAVKEAWPDGPYAYDSWNFSEDTCRFEPPTPYPTTLDDPDYYVWNEETTSWVKP